MKTAVGEISTSPTIDSLTGIWQRVLHLQTIGVQDNFFDLGGDSVLAVQLFAEIADVYGRQLPPVLIYHVPTIAAQVALLEEPTAQQFSPLVLLKSGRDEGPIFIAPGLGGGAAEFFQLVKHIRTTRAIYALQPRGLDGFERPPDNIHDMADIYLNAIQELQPGGPYVLFGYSLGGLVALEMARRLSVQGKKTALLVMLDSYPHISFLRLGQRMKLRLQRLNWRLTSLMHGVRNQGPGTLDPEEMSTFAPGMDVVKNRAFAALQSYRPEFYPGMIRFVRAATISNFPPDPTVVWRDLIADFIVETVPGDHLGMLTRHHMALGKVLTRYLEEINLPAHNSGAR